MIRFSLKETMARQKVSIQDLSDNTGLSRTTISNISNNLAQGIQLDTLDKILKYLGVTVTEIIEFQNDYIFRVDVTSINYNKKLFQLSLTLRIILLRKMFRFRFSLILNI